MLLILGFISLLGKPSFFIKRRLLFYFLIISFSNALQYQQYDVAKLEQKFGFL